MHRLPDGGDRDTRRQNGVRAIRSYGKRVGVDAETRNGMLVFYE
jgi:hypothetical protein